jgi:adenylylsulfate kinase-like enzyme
MIIVLFGQPGSGKSTLANILTAELPADNIDGDNLRTLFANKDYSREGRIKNLNRASDIAHFLNYKNEGYIHVVLSLVYPYKEARDYLNSLTNDVKWIFLMYENVDGQERGREQFHVNDFEYPTVAEALYLNTTWLTEKECINEIKKYINE